MAQFAVTELAKGQLVHSPGSLKLAGSNLEVHAFYASYPAAAKGFHHTNDARAKPRGINMSFWGNVIRIVRPKSQEVNSYYRSQDVAHFSKMSHLNMPISVLKYCARKPITLKEPK